MVLCCVNKPLELVGGKMKKLFLKICLISSILGLVSCASTNVTNNSKGGIRIPDTISENIPDTELAKIIFDKYVGIYSIDKVYNKKTFLGYKADLENPLPHSLSGYNAGRTVLLEPGIHSISVTFNNGRVYTQSPNDLNLKISAGDVYKITAKIEGSRIVYDILDKDGISLSNPKGMTLKQRSIETYQSEVIDKVKNGKQVRLTTHGVEWLFKSENEITITENGEKQNAFITFNTNENLSEGLIYIKFSDNQIISVEDFKNMDLKKSDRIYEIDIVEKGITGLAISLISKTKKIEDLYLHYWGM